MLANFWSHPGHLRQLAKPCAAQPTPSHYYRFARGGLCLTCDDLQFADRFRLLFAECVASEAELSGFQVFSVGVATHDASNTSVISLDANESVDYSAFILELFPERNLQRVPGQAPAGWRFLGESGGSEPVIAVSGSQLMVDRSYPWQAIVAQFAVSNVMRLQRDVRFFHAATVGVGNHGVFIAGAKGSGKTTLSLALAARFHAFLGDEYAAVCVRTGALLPFRRAVSIRPGARAAKVEARLQGMNPLTDKTEDGLNRVRLSVGELFPEAAARSVNLSHCFFLRGFQQRPGVVEFSPGNADLPLLQPLLASLWSQRRGLLVLDFLRLFSQARCFYLNAGGTPDETAELIERVVEDK